MKPLAEKEMGNNPLRFDYIDLSPDAPLESFLIRIEFLDTSEKSLACCIGQSATRRTCPVCLDGELD